MTRRNVLFVHDGPIYCNQDRTEFYGVHYDDDLVERYSTLGDKVAFLMRAKEIASSRASQYTKIRHQAFSFLEIPDHKSLRGYWHKSEVIRRIRDAVASHDVILVRLPSAAGAMAFQLARKLRKPLLVEMVACPFDALWNYDWRGKALAHYKRREYQGLMMQASHVIYVTNSFLQKRYPTRGKSLGCSDVFLPPADEKALGRRLGQLSSRQGIPVLGTIAAIDVAYKGQGDVIRALAKMKRAGILLRYKVIGPGDPSILRKCARANGVEDLVEIIGSVPHGEISEQLQDIDVYIQPSKQEGLPRALLEAMALGCPALGANTGGIPELLEEPFLFQPGDISEMAETISRILKDRSQLEDQARKNFERAKAYQKDALDARRRCFYAIFLKDHNLAD